MEAQVFRIVQEALTNVRKHAGAHRAEVGFAFDDGGLEVVIATTGTAVEAPPSTTTTGRRYGLRAMRERAASIGATVDWTTQPDGGCVRAPRRVPSRSAHPGRIGDRR